MIRNKIIEFEEPLFDFVTSKETLNIPIVLTNGCFDLYHAGHVDFLEKIKRKHRDSILFVGVNTDESVKKIKGDKRPFCSEENRAICVASHQSVSFVFLFDDLVPFIKKINPDFYYKGSDRNINTIDIKEKKALQDCNCNIGFIPREIMSSTTSILHEIQK